MAALPPWAVSSWCSAVSYHYGYTPLSGISLKSRACARQWSRSSAVRTFFDTVKIGIQGRRRTWWWSCNSCSSPQGSHGSKGEEGLLNKENINWDLFSKNKCGNKTVKCVSKLDEIYWKPPDRAFLVKGKPLGAIICDSGKCIAHELKMILKNGL